MFFYYLITILPWLIEPYFFLPFPRFRYLFSNNFLLNIILYLFFFLFLSLMFFCFFLFFILSSQNRTYFTMITLGHHTAQGSFKFAVHFPRGRGRLCGATANQSARVLKQTNTTPLYPPLYVSLWLVRCAPGSPRMISLLYCFKLA